MNTEHKIMKTLLFLDDYRNPFERDWVERFSPIKTDLEIHWVKKYNEFTQWILLNGLPDVICFDHDLGFEHIKYYFDNGGHQNQPDPSKADFIEKTGYDAAKWLVDYCVDNNLKLPLYGIQSSNEVGKENIDEYLKNYIKHVENK